MCVVDISTRHVQALIGSSGAVFDMATSSQTDDAGITIPNACAIYDRVEGSASTSA